MKSEELLKAVGKIDDELIEAAEMKKDSKTLHQLKETKERKISFKPFVKTAAVLVCAFALGIGLLSTGLRAGKAAPMDMAETEEAYDMNYGAADGVYEYATDISASEEQKLKAESARVREEKLVYNASLSLQTTEYDKAYEELKALAEKLGGYFESTNVYNGNYNATSQHKNGSFVVRIPVDKYDQFMSEASSSWHVASKSENVQKITDAYYELEDRINTLRIKEERLQDLLKQASSLSDIIELENSLSNTEYELNSLLNQIKGMDNQVEYATIYIDLSQVTQLGDTIGSEGFGRRLVRAFKNGITNFAEGIADFVVWMGYNIIEIIIAVAVIFIIIKFHLIRRLINWIKK